MYIHGERFIKVFRVVGLASINDVRGLWVFGGLAEGIPCG
jgi:hypothetical protein